MINIRRDKTNLKCPLCNKFLYEEYDWTRFNLDDNKVFVCESNKDHKYWRSSNQQDTILHLNKKSNISSIKSEITFIKKDKNWKKC